MARQLDNSDEYCFACGRNNPIGLHLDFKFDGDKYIAKKTVPREYQGYKDIVHGGIVTTMLDEAMGGYVIDKYKKMVDFNSLWRGIIWTFVGAVCGTWSVLLLDATVIKYLIPICLVAILIYTIFSPNLGEIDKPKIV